MRELVLILWLTIFTCPLIGQKKFCADSSIRVKYSFNFIQSEFVNVPDTAGQNVFLGGVSNPAGLGVVFKTTWGDSVYYLKKFQSSLGQLGFLGGVQIPGNDIIAMGSFENKELLVAHINTNGQPIWINRYKFATQNLDFYSGRYTYKNIFFSGGYIYMLSELRSTQLYMNAVLKLDLNGNIVWSKAFKKNGAQYDYFSNGITKYLDEVVVVSDVFESTASGQIQYPVITRLRDFDGAVIENTAIKIPNDPVVKGLTVQSIQSNLDSTFSLIGQTCTLIMGNMIPSGKAFSLRLTRDFSLLRGYWYEPNNLFVTFDMNLNQSKALLFQSQPALNSKYFTILDDQENVYRTRRFTMPLAVANGEDSPIYIDPKSNLHILFSYDQNSRTYLEYLRLSDLAPANTANCFGTDTNLVQRFSFPISKETFSWDLEESNVISQNPLPVTVQNEPVEKELICKQISYCDSVKVIGAQQVCYQGPAVRYTSYLNPQCLKQMKWAVDTSFVKIISTESDTTITVQFKQPGQTYIKAFVQNCVVADSMLVTISNPQSSLQLPKSKTELCPGETINLQVNPNFRSYLWQDASTQPGYTITAPGFYKVIAIDSCGNTISDSITIQLGNTSLPLQNVYTICQFDSARLLLPNDIQNVTWQPSTSGILVQNRLLLYPSQTTDFLIQGRRQQGCNVQKTIKVIRETCPQWVKFPSGFTPNNDGLNDTFKPGCSGHLLEYELRIYNRGGGVIFKSTTPNLGWNGKYKGEFQPSGVYIYLASFRFGGEEKQLQKGTLVLIR